MLLIPAFAVGRAQQMIVLMDRLVSEGRMRAFPIHVDSPMAIDATLIYSRYPEAHRVRLEGIGGQSLLHGKWLRFHRTRKESEELNTIKLSGIRRPPRRVFLTHGEDEAALALSARIGRERGFPTHVPEMGETVELP